MIRYLLYDLGELSGDVAFCFGVKRLFTVHGLHRLPRKTWRALLRLLRTLRRLVWGLHVHPAPREHWGR